MCFVVFQFGDGPLGAPEHRPPSRCDELSRNGLQIGNRAVVHVVPLEQSRHSSDAACVAVAARWINEEAHRLGQFCRQRKRVQPTRLGHVPLELRPVTERKVRDARDELL